MGQHCVECRGGGTAAAAATQPPGQARTISSRRTPVTYALMAINVVIFGYLVTRVQGVGDVQFARPISEFGLWPPAVHDGEWWRIVTSGFLHLSLIHLAVNMLSLWIVGREIEMTLGSLRFIGIYFAGLLGGSAGVMWFAGAMTNSVGASGAIYGLLGAILLIAIRFRLQMTQLLVIIGLNLVLTVTIPGISIWAHFGGFLAGMSAAAAILYLPLTIPPQRRTVGPVSSVGWAGLASVIAVATALALLA